MSCCRSLVILSFLEAYMQRTAATSKLEFSSSFWSFTMTTYYVRPFSLHSQEVPLSRHPLSNGARFLVANRKSVVAQTLFERVHRSILFVWNPMFSVTLVSLSRFGGGSFLHFKGWTDRLSVHPPHENEECLLFALTSTTYLLNHLLHPLFPHLP